MPILVRVLAIAAILPAFTLSAQEAQSTQEQSLVDPTAESVEIKSQLDTIRGVEEMGVLKKQLSELISQNQKLMERLQVATVKIDAMQIEMDILRKGQEDAARRRAALPELRLVSQVRTDASKQADVADEGRTYRILDGRAFRIVLGNNEMLIAKPIFLDDGTIEIKIDELDAVQLLSFRASAPEPSVKHAASHEVDND